jgi:hypothetical protein
MRSAASHTPAGLLAAAAPDIGATVVQRRGGRLTVSLPVQRMSRTQIFVLEVDAQTADAEVREATPTHLPSFCPERHINKDGWFCLAFDEAEQLLVLDSQAAEAWWARTWKFLNLQLSAERLRKWPNQAAWAHGDAAPHQRRAEACARALGLEEVLAEGALKVRSRGDFDALLVRGRKQYSVWRRAGRAATQRQPCLCGSGLTLSDCADHAARAADLPRALTAWRREGEAFWRACKGRPCCRTIDGCPLRNASAAPANIDVPASRTAAAAA